VIEQRIADLCPICGATKQVYLFEIHGYSVTSCAECGLTLSAASAMPGNSDRFSIHMASAQEKKVFPEGKTQIEASKRYLRMLAERSKSINTVLLIAEPGHCFAAMAKDFGFTVLRHISIAELEQGTDLPKAVDSVVVIYELERANDIEKALNRIYKILRPRGELFIVLLSLDSVPARFFGQSWIGSRPENHYYFDNTTIQSLLWKSGFNEIQQDKDLRWYTLAHIYDRALSFPKTWITRSVITAYHALPSQFRGVYFRLPTSGTVISARKSDRRMQPLLSVVLPV
jgi:hypothetical protein